MNYFDGQEVLVGDTQHSKERWSYLGRGVMIEFPSVGVIHYVDPEEDLILLGRALD